MTKMISLKLVTGTAKTNKTIKKHRGQFDCITWFQPFCNRSWNRVENMKIIRVNQRTLIDVFYCLWLWALERRFFGGAPPRSPSRRIKCSQILCYHDQPHCLSDQKMYPSLPPEGSQLKKDSITNYYFFSGRGLFFVKHILTLKAFKILFCWNE